MSLDGLAENIFLLEKITKTPEDSHDNPIPAQLQKCQPSRMLRLEHEQSIVSALSFLSSYTDDCDKVSALCIEEMPDRRGFLINIASNSGDAEKLKAGLERLGVILMDEATDDRRENNAEELLRRIIEFNRFRLLCRLRSTHSSWRARTRQPIIDGLAEALEKLRVLNTVTIETMQGLELITQRLVTQFRRLENLDKIQARSEQVDKLLLSILRTSNQLDAGYQLEGVLGTIPQGDPSFPDSRKTSLVEGFRKLSRYVALGPLLLRFARRLPAFRNVLVRVIKIRSTVPTGLHNGPTGVVPEGLLRQYLNHQIPVGEEMIERFEHRLGANLADIQADLQKKALVSKRIHAEIQLLFHYEQGPQTQLKPRVICASKNACYLCNLFLSLHNQFYTPRTHGKLYPQWTLPDLAALSVSKNRRRQLRELCRRFNARIEQEIIACLGTATLVQNFENESRIFHIRSLTASEASIVQAPVADLGLHDSTRGPRTPSHDRPPLVQRSRSHSDNHDILKGSSVASSSSSRKSTHHSGSRRASCSTSTLQDPAQLSTPPTPGDMERSFPVSHSAESTMLKPIQLVPSHPIMSFVSTSSSPIRLHTSRIHVEISYDHALSIASPASLELQESNAVDTRRGVEVCAVWLMADETETTNSRPGDVDLAADWACKKLDGVMFDPEGLRLRKGRDVLKLSAAEVPERDSGFSM